LKVFSALRQLVPAVCLLVALGGCVAAPLHRLAGTVVVGPVCGGALREGPECVAPLGATELRLVDGAGQVAARAVTDATGHFVLSAPAGAYRLRVAAPKVVQCPEMTVQLPMGDAPPLRVSCDSGMR
jgi:hypothetical protein